MNRRIVKANPLKAVRMRPTDTRASIITPPGEGGIGVVALCGPDAAGVLARAFVGTKRRAGEIAVGAIAHGTIRRAGAVVDEVIVARLEPEPGAGDGAYFEVNCHGGVVATKAVLRCLQDAGARAVDPLELQPAPAARPAPLSGTAIRQSALARLPRARTRLTAAMLLHQAGGALDRELRALADLLGAAKDTEAKAQLDALLRTAALGRALIEPPKVALLGPPNVGKSTLLNALIEEERVIVHHEPGTTRDVVAETVSVRGVPFELMDCAGIHESEDELERLAVRRAAALAETCDVALLLFDAREAPESVAGLVPALRKRARAIIVGNKADLLRAGATPPGTEQAVYISAKERTGLDRLESALLEPYAGLIEACRRGAPVAFNEAIEEALREVAERLRTGGPAAALAALRDLTEPPLGCPTGP